MATILDDNTVIPSYLGVETRGSSYGQQIMNVFSLQIGEVIAIYYPKDKGNQSGLYIEYDVEVRHREGSEGQTLTVYKNCISVSGFGSTADRTDTTFRVSSESPDAGEWGDGAKVLVLCISGNRNRSVILGGISNTDRKSDTGHAYTFEFNGINCTINKAGEVSITRKGITNTKGKYLEKDITTGESTTVPTTGATIYMHKDGSVGIQDSGGQNIVLMPEQDDTAMGVAHLGLEQVEADTFYTKWNVHGNFRLIAKKAVQSNSGGGESQPGVVYFDPEDHFEIGNGSQKMIRGTDYRNSEHQCNSDLAQGLGNLGMHFQQSSIILKTAVPNVASLSAALQSLGVELQQMQTICLQMQQSLNRHEGRSKDFESRHTLD